jgi:hypothetical protein
VRTPVIGHHHRSSRPSIPSNHPSFWTTVTANIPSVIDPCLYVWRWLRELDLSILRVVFQ